MKSRVRIALTGFMGVGKSSVARHLANLLECERIDLDNFIEDNENRKIVDIIDTDGVAAYRRIETANLQRLLAETSAPIISLGGGTWTVKFNRELITRSRITSVWLESTFEHCWYNIRASKKERPLARSKAAAEQLFNDRQRIYCLADWHFIIRPEFTSFDVAKHIVDQIFL